MANSKLPNLLGGYAHGGLTATAVGASTHQQMQAQASAMAGQATTRIGGAAPGEASVPCEMPPEWRAEIDAVFPRDAHDGCWNVSPTHRLSVSTVELITGLPCAAAAELASKVFAAMAQRRILPSLLSVQLMNLGVRTELFGEHEETLSRELSLPPDRSWLHKWFNAMTTGNLDGVLDDPRPMEVVLRARVGEHPSLRVPATLDPYTRAGERIYPTVPAETFPSAKSLLSTLAERLASGQYRLDPHEVEARKDAINRYKADRAQEVKTTMDPVYALNRMLQVDPATRIPDAQLKAISPLFGRLFGAKKDGT